MEPDHQLKNSLAIIPARGGSKRIPRKNIKNFLGKPIIAYSIEAAMKAGCFAEVIVSTDDAEIAEIAKAYGAHIPFYRSDKNSDDHATTAEVITEVLDSYESRLGKKFDSFCCIYPTAPFITPDKLKRAKNLLEEENVTSVIPVVAFSFPILRSLTIKEDHLKFNWPEYTLTRSQDLPSAYHDSGQFYFVNTAAFRETGNFFTPCARPIILSELEIQDIDTETDWKIAEMKYRIINEV
ncbi:MAG: pseudaminic acid cytidylyltransferase [Sphingobacteriales bacterium]|nr:MAG: pseudaminic acid cytidylyltransferase [Sphingobacteriales bacterium]